MNLHRLCSRNLTVEFLFTLLLLFPGCKEKTSPDTFTVSGTIKGLDTEFMTRSYRDENGERVSDSIFVTDDYFTYTAKITEPEFIFFWPNVERTIKRSGRGYYPVKSSQFAFLASPGDEIIFEGEVKDFINAYPTGTKANDDLASINRRIFPMMNQSINMLLEANMRKEGDSVRVLMEDSIKILDKRVLELKKEFVRTKTGSEAAAWYLSDMMLRRQLTDDEAIEVFNSLSKELEDYQFYRDVAMRIKGIETTRIGSIMPNFTSKRTPEGEEFELYSLRGKYVLIDFWGTWCGPCIEEMPRVQEYGEKYRDKLVVLGVNQGDSKKKMMEFIDEKGYDWQQVMTGEGDEDLVLKFNVQGFPTKIILDPKGKILYRFLGETDESFEVLDELLGG